MWSAVSSDNVKYGGVLHNKIHLSPQYKTYNYIYVILIIYMLFNCYVDYNIVNKEYVWNKPANIILEKVLVFILFVNYGILY